MSRLLGSVAVLALAVLVASPAWAAKEDGKKKGNKSVAKVFELPAEITLTAEQKTKLEEVKKEFEPKVTEITKKQDEILTAEQKKARAEAQKAGKAAGKKGKDLKADVDAAVKLTDEQKKKQEETSKELKDVTGKVREKISSFLTEEQKTHLKTKKKKKNA